MSQLTTAVNGSTTAYFWYDGLGRICIRQINGGTGVRFNVFDGWNLVEDYKLDDTLDGRYLQGAGGGELVSLRINAQTYYLYQDGRGNTSHLADANGNIVEKYKYDLDGRPTVYDPSGNEITDGSVVGNRFLFNGEEYFKELGLYNLRNRFYFPTIGRFLQPDPIGFAGDPINLYRYCGNNPVNWSDPNGTVGGWVGAGAGAIGGFAGGLAGGFVQEGSNSINSGAPVNWDSVLRAGGVGLLTGAATGFGEIFGPDPASIALATGVVNGTIGGTLTYSIGPNTPVYKDSSSAANSSSNQTTFSTVMGSKGYSVTGVYVDGNSSGYSWDQPVSSNPAVNALNSALSRAAYRSKNGLIYDANGNLIGDASSLFQFDSTNVSIYIEPFGPMTLPSPSQT